MSTLIMTPHRQSRPFWSHVLTGIILPLGDLAFGQRMMQRLNFLEKAQWWDREKLCELQTKSLRTLIEIAYKETPFYYDLMKNAGISPDDIKTPDDLSRLPIVTKAMFLSGYPHQTTRNLGRKTYEVKTSGSTGTNFCVIEDAETAGWHRASFILDLIWAGWQIGEPHMQTGMTPNRSFDRWLKDMFLKCYYSSAYDLSNERLDNNLEVLENNKIKHLWGYPGSLYFMAKRALERGWNQPLHSIVTWGDNLYPHYRQVIEKAFKTRVFDTYGCAEGVQIAAQCGQGNTYHIHVLDVIVEFVDDYGRPVAANQPGNIVLTRLHPGPMPLIRYAVGDVGIKGSEDPCACQRGFDTMETVQGRDTDYIVTPSGNRLIVHFFTGILEHFRTVKSFLVVQEEPGSMTIKLILSEPMTDALKREIMEIMRERGAEDMKIFIEVVDNIPASASGKRRFVINKTLKSVDNVDQ